MQRITVIVKGTKNCNLACRYCSVGNPAQKHLSVEDAIIAVTRIVKRVPGSFTQFIWHGGEPLLLGLDFYKQIAKVQDKLRKEGFVIDNCIQSNGTLINDDWALFFKESNFRIGLSLDGPQEINDRSRVFSNDRGTFDAIMRGSRILDRHGIKHGFLVVISQYNAEHIDEIMDFMESIGKTYQLSNCLPLGRASKDKNATSLIPPGQAFSTCQLKIFDRWLSEGSKQDESAIRDCLTALLTQNPRGCTFREDCQQHFIGMDWNAGAWPCGRFIEDNPVYKPFYLGNFLRDSFEEIWGHSVRGLFSRRKEQLTKCDPCTYKKICNGGCPVLGILNGGIDEPDSNCSEYLRIFTEMDKRIREEAGVAIE